MKEIMFVGMNISKISKELLNGQRESITKGMSDTEIKAYDLGVMNALSIVNQLVTDCPDADFVVNTPDSVMTEYTYFDLKNKKW